MSENRELKQIQTGKLSEEPCEALCHILTKSYLSDYGCALADEQCAECRSCPDNPSNR